MDQQIAALRLFIRIVEAGSFAKAADALQVPRATATKLIQQLEAHVGAKLLQRTTRRMSITIEGAAYYERASRLLVDLDELDASVGAVRAGLRGKLRVDVGSSVANLLLIPALPKFLKRNPEIEVALGVSDRNVNLVEEGVDCVIRAGAMGDTSLVATRVAELSFVTCASPSYVATFGAPKHPRELKEGARHRVVRYASALSGRPIPLHFERGGQVLEFSVPNAFTVNESTAHLTALLAGLGIGQTFSFMAQPRIDEGSLTPLLTDWSMPPQSLFAVYPPNRHLNAKVRAFIDWTKELFAQSCATDRKC